MIFFQGVVILFYRHLLLKMQFQEAFPQNKDMSYNSIHCKVQFLFGEMMDIHPREKDRPGLSLFICVLCPLHCANPFLQKHPDPLSSHKPLSHILSSSTHQIYEKELAAIRIFYIFNCFHAFKIQLVSNPLPK